MDNPEKYWSNPSVRTPYLLRRRHVESNSHQSNVALLLEITSPHESPSALALFISNHEQRKESPFLGASLGVEGAGRARCFCMTTSVEQLTDAFAGLPRNHYGAILADPPWAFATWSHVGLAGDKTQANRGQRSRAAPYQTMSHDDICELPVGDLAAGDCVLFLWVVQTQLPQAVDLITRWGFEFKSVAFSWFKGDGLPLFPDDVQVPIGCGYWTRAGFEQCWIATRGKPKRLHADVRQVLIEKRREHSRKPDGIHERIERLVAGPYLELFARQSRPNWTTWGNQATKFDKPESQSVVSHPVGEGV